ncbi:MAG TPA: alpha-2-macroglobulin, partial [Vulgatibacter sp.]
TRTFALWVLARTGAPLPSYYGEIFGRRERLPLYGRAMLADAMFVGKGDRARARLVLDELLVHAKESPQQVHFEEPGLRADPWSSDARTSAVVLQTLATISPDHPFVPKLARYLTGARGRDGRYRNTQEAAHALMALSDVVRQREKETPAYQATASLAGAQVASARFDGRSMRVERTSLPVERLGVGGALTFRKEGAGRLYYGALLRYAPAELPTTALDQGLMVQRWFEPWAGGGQVRQLVAGELVRVKVRIASPQERRYAVVAVPIPAGLEVVDTSLATTAVLPREAPSSDGDEEGDSYEGEDETDAGPWASRFFDPFNHEERRDGQVVFFADYLPPGVHTTSFVARATTPGDFVLQPAHAEEMYAPEVFGRSDGGRMRVVDHAGVAEK